MKFKSLAVLSLALGVLVGCRKAGQGGSSGGTPVAPGPRTFSSFDTSVGTNAPVPAHMIHFQEADVSQVLAVYQELSGRSLIRSPRVPMSIKITFENVTPLSRVEVLQALDNVFAANGIIMVYLGTKYVKVISAVEAASETGPVVELPPEQLPDSSSFLLYIVRLNHRTPQEVMPGLMPFAKLPNGIIGMNNENLLILRDYSSNVRRMLQVLEEIDRGPGLQKTAEKLLKRNAAPSRRP